MLAYRFLIWAGQRAPVLPLYTICRSLGYSTVPILAASFLAILKFEMGGLHSFFQEGDGLVPPSKYSRWGGLRSNNSRWWSPSFRLAKKEVASVHHTRGEDGLGSKYSR